MLDALRERIRAIAPHAEEVISYKIPAFRVEGKVVIGFKANKSDYSIYPSAAERQNASPRSCRDEPSRQARSTSHPRTRSQTTCSDRIIEWRIQANRERGGH